MASESKSARPRPLVLCILDGFGERAEREGNAILLAKTPNLDDLTKSYPHTTIGTSGPDVGLPVGQMGNSEVGHLNFGAGRIAMMDITRIDQSISDLTFAYNPVIDDMIMQAKEKNCRLHLFGLLSDGGVHSSFDHLVALIDAASQQQVRVVVHAFLDGRDVPPKSASQYIQQLEYWLDDKGVIGTVSGRYYAMDRDKRWDRVQKAYEAIVRGEGSEHAATPMYALEDAYAEGTSDEFVAPRQIGEYTGIVGKYCADFGGEREWIWLGDEVGICFNFRPDRMRELCAMLLRKNLPPELNAELLDRTKKVFAFDTTTLCSLVEYDPSLGLRVAFPKDDVADSFGEVIARAGLKQLRCAETEKYAHVTYFFSGGREQPFEGEDRKLVASPRDVATYDLKPEMSAPEIAREVAGAVESGAYDFILVNFANPDMVGHTGQLAPAIDAVEAVDASVGVIWSAIKAAGGALLVTSDHGNCEQMKDSEGHPHTAHTTNPVPLIYASDGGRRAKLNPGRICDVAPTMLEILGIPKPEAMTGRSLFSE